MAATRSPLTGPLVDDYDATTEPDAPSPRRVARNFIYMSVAFSINHGTVTACVALASSELGAGLGNTSLGVLYCCYTLAAAFLAHGVVARLGAKKTLALGLGVYCCYVASYVVAALSPTARRPAVLLGAALGGLAAGCLWPAQGAYFAHAAERYAAASGMTREEATSLLGSWFSGLYLLGEVAMKLLSTVPALAAAPKLLYAVYAAAAVAATVVVTAVDDVDAAARKEPPAFGTSALSAVRLFSSSPLARCLFPMNCAFGFGASYLNGYFMSAVVAPGVGKSAIGAVSSIVVATAALAALPLGRLGAALGAQAPVVAVGAACFGLFGLANLGLSADALGHWPQLIALACTFGVGRSVWETNFKASVADFFPRDKSAAFANLQLQSGLASTIGFFVNPRLAPDMLAWVAVGSAAAAVAAQVLAARLHAARGYAGVVGVEDATSLAA